jgi:hypothetical protein
MVFSAHWLLIGHSQWLLKEEWETVKFEAAGWCRRFILIVKRWRRAWAYRVFCRDDGSLAILAVDADKLALTESPGIVAEEKIGEKEIKS